MSDNRHPLVVKLKSGEYDGNDLMQAWLLIESQQEQLTELREAAQRVFDAKSKKDLDRAHIALSALLKQGGE